MKKKSKRVYNVSVGPTEKRAESRPRYKSEGGDAEDPPQQNNLPGGAPDVKGETKCPQ